MRGFTLIELSIVLIIIGLLVGGVLAGRDLIDAAKQSATVRDFRNYETSLNTFQLKYNALPGDMDNATDYWSGTADGNGDQRVAPYDELYRAWQQLGLSGLIEGQYTGTHTDNQGVAGVNLPEAQYEGGAYSFFDNGTQTYFGKIGGHQLSLGSEVEENTHVGDLLDVVQAQAIDAKLDDGVANTGRVYGMDGTGGQEAGTCSEGLNDDTGEDYNLSSSGAACRMSFWYDNY